jgi:predicted nucleic acid-binding protein
VITARTVVLDASVLVRSAVQASTGAREWVEAVEAGMLEAHVPELVYAEVGNSFAKYARAERMIPGDATSALAAITTLPLRTHPLRELTSAALALALDSGLSVYDGCYAALALALDAPLVTADRRLAAAIDGAELVDR